MCLLSFWLWKSFDQMKSFKSAILVLVFAALVSAIYLYFLGDLKLLNKTEPNAADTTFLKTEEQFRTKLAELRIEKDKLERRKRLMEERKQETVTFLKDKGVTSQSSLDAQDVKYAVKNLKRSVADIKVVEKNIKRYDEGIVAIAAMLKKLEQERLANEIAVSDERKIEISAMVKRLDDELVGEEDDIFADEQLRELLGEELGK
jgi:hypothetical protein